MSLYDDLGVDPDASIDEISAAYRRRAKSEHPDAGGDPEKFAQLSYAVAILRDPQRRAQYDRDGSTEEPVHPIEAGAIQMLSQMFLSVLDQIGTNDGQVDAIAAIAKLVFEQRQQIQVQTMNLKNNSRIATRALGRLKKRGDGRNVLGRLLEDRLTAFADGLRQMEEMTQVLDRVVELSRDYSWELDHTTYGTAQSNQWFAGALR